MQLTPSAHVDTFCRDNLPPADQWPELLFDLPELQYGDRLNCAVELLDAVTTHLGGDRPCLLAPDGTTWTYSELRARANQVAHHLVEAHGLVPGNRVLLRGPNNPWLVACWFGVLKAGGVAVTTMPLLRAGELSQICDMAALDLAICDHRFLDDLRAVDVPGLRILPYGGADPEDLVQRTSEAPQQFEAVETAADDVALLAFTSGTTGRPKATMHFHRDVLANADTFSRHVLNPRPDDVFTGTPPLAFTFGLGGLVVFPLRVGASTLLVEKASPDQLADLIGQHSVSVCFTAPTAYRAMIASGLTVLTRYPDGLNVVHQVHPDGTVTLLRRPSTWSDSECPPIREHRHSDERKVRAANPRGRALVETGWQRSIRWLVGRGLWLMLGAQILLLAGSLTFIVVALAPYLSP